MRKHIFAKTLLCFITAVAVLAGCAQTPPNVKPIAGSEHPADLTKQLGKDLEKARQDQVNLLSPDWFGDARDSYAKAKSGLKGGKTLSSVLEDIAMGQAQLAQALNVARKSRKTLSDVIKSRDAALKAGANQYDKEFSRLEMDFLDLTEAFEDNNPGYVRKKKATVNGRYRALELRAIKDAKLADMRRLMATAEEMKMQASAPKSFMIAKSKLMNADAVIGKNRYDIKAINRAVREAEFYGQRLHQIAAVSGKVEKMAPEEIALWMERFFAQTNLQLKEKDSRNLSFKQQHEKILSAVDGLQRDHASSSSQLQAREMKIEKLNQRVADLEGRTYQERADKERLAADKKRLAEEKAFNERYYKVQGYFSAEQADVYKKSRHLVIRLKAMRFPVGKAVIVPANYPLLTTVRKAIQTFDSPDVVIEGHSDSTGSEKLNLNLSRKRAESVRQYMIHNGVLPADKIEAKGYGSSRPLASNATSRGRAINRRIDVIVKPVMK